MSASAAKEGDIDFLENIADERNESHETQSMLRFIDRVAKPRIAEMIRLWCDGYTMKEIGLMRGTHESRVSQLLTEGFALARVAVNAQ